MPGIFNRQYQKDRRKQLRNTMPKAEILLWSRLKGRQICGLRFRRQYGVDRYIIDFYCPQLNLAIELDGDSHFQEETVDYDIERQQFIESLGIRCLRFTNIDVYENIDGVLFEICNVIKELSNSNLSFDSPSQK